MRLMSKVHQTVINVDDELGERLLAGSNYEKADKPAPRRSAAKADDSKEG